MFSPFPLPQLGQFTLEDSAGMRPAVMVLQKSLTPGRYNDHLHWDITRIYSVSYGNIWSDGVMVLGLATLESSDRNMVVTTTPTRGTWLERFMRGKNKQTIRIKRNNFGFLGGAFHAPLEDLK